MVFVREASGGTRSAEGARIEAPKATREWGHLLPRRRSLGSAPPRNYFIFICILVHFTRFLGLMCDEGWGLERECPHPRGRSLGGGRAPSPENWFYFLYEMVHFGSLHFTRSFGANVSLH